MGNSATMRFLTSAICFLLTFVCGLSICSCSAKSSANTGATINASNSAPESVATSSKFEIVCWGDSLTAGNGADNALIKLGDNTYFNASYLSYPQILQKLTGANVHNFGVSGATSKEIALMQGANVDMVISDCEVYDESISALSREHLGNVLIIEMGSNGGWDNYQDLIEQYHSMINHAQTDKYIIIGDTDGPGASADNLQDEFSEGESTRATSWELALQEEFGNHFINMRIFLIEHGLEEANLPTTAEDLELAARGCVSPQLRTDFTHLNSYGYYAKARAVYEKGAELRYWNMHN